MVNKYLDKSILNQKLLYLILLLILFSCNKKIHNVEISSENNSKSSTENPTLPQKISKLAPVPKVLWKIYSGYGKAQLLLKQGNIIYCFLESRIKDHKELSLLAINITTGKMIYHKKDFLDSYIQPFIKKNIIYYNNNTSFQGLDIASKRAIISLPNGKYVPYNSVKKDQTIVLLQKLNKNPQLSEYTNLLALNTQSNKILWEIRHPNKKLFETKHNIFYLSDNSTLHAINTLYGQTIQINIPILFTSKKPLHIIDSDEDFLYVKYDKQFYAFSSHKRNITWQISILSNQSTRILNSDKKNILLNNGDNTYLISKSSGKIIWSQNTPGNFHKIIDEKYLIYMTIEKLFAINYSTGKRIGEISHPSTRDFPDYIQTSYYYFNTTGNGNYIIRRLNLSEKQIDQISYHVMDNGYDHYSRNYLNLSSKDSLLFLGSISSYFMDQKNHPISLTFHAFDKDTGKVKWSYAGFKGDYISQPAFINNSILVSSNTGHLISFDTNTGNKEWELQTSTNLNIFMKTSLIRYLFHEKSKLYLYFAGSIYALDIPAATK